MPIKMLQHADSLFRKFWDQNWSPFSMMRMVGHFGGRKLARIFVNNRIGFETEEESRAMTELLL